MIAAATLARGIALHNGLTDVHYHVIRPNKRGPGFVPGRNQTKDDNQMAVEILLPKLGFSMTEGQVAEWLANDGDEVTEGQPLYSLEADKSTNEVEAPATGKLKIVIQPGEAHEVGTVLGYIE